MRMEILVDPIKRERLNMKNDCSKGSDRETIHLSGYMNCDFILGLAAEVERLWSIATNVLTDERKKTSPLMLEAVLFYELILDFGMYKQ